MVFFIFVFPRRKIETWGSELRVGSRGVSLKTWTVYQTRKRVNLTEH